MAPTTHAQACKSPPKTPTRSPIKRKEKSTNRKYRFFHVYEERAGVATFKSICDDNDILTPLGRKWLWKRDELGDAAWHKTRKLSDKLGMLPKASVEQIQAMVNPQKNLH
jgi:hypothetical protein